MLKNYLKIAVRSVNRQKVYTSINVLGLSIGMAAAMLILLWVRDERSYDRFHENADRIYRAYRVAHYGEHHHEQTQTPAVLAARLREECPDVDLVTCLRGYRDEFLVIADGRKFIEGGLGIADEFFFQLFSFPLISGNPESVLTEPYTVAISEKAARKYFGDSDAIGQVLTVFDKDYVVTGVFEDMPEQSHFHLDVLRSFTSFEQYQEPNWGMNVFKTYILLKEEGSATAVEKQLTDIVKNHMFDSHEQYTAVIAEGNYTKFPIQPLKDIHLKSHLLWEFETNGNKTYVQFFTVIALFVLLIAAINYMNLSTARSARRAREVGIRKTVGSTRSSLIRLFLTESILLSLLAMVLALIALQMMMPSFRTLVAKPWLDIPFMTNPVLLIPLILFGVLVGILSGIYPSFYLSSFRPITMLGNKLGQATKCSQLRNVLVVTQFSISIVLLIGTLVVQKQMSFTQDRNLGFKRDQVVVIETFGELGQRLPVLKESLLRNPSIEVVSASSSVPGKPFTNVGFKLEGTANYPGTNLIIADMDYRDVLQLELAEGRFFSEEIRTDEYAVILNETKARELGVDDLLNKRMETWLGGDGNVWLHIIGIVKDFHYESLHESIYPVCIVLLDGACQWDESYVSIRVRTSDMRKAMNFIQDSWNEIVPETPFECSFLDTIYYDQYQNESRTGYVFTLFTALALFVACLGLLGLASFAAEQRTKEIGIRKVLGADMARIIVMLSKDFQKLIVIANLVAWPLAYFVMNRWLQSFAYRTSIGFWIFAVAGVLAFVIAFLAVLFHSLRAATANPVESLKYE